MRGATAMRENSADLDLLIGAVTKLNAATGERENVVAFIQSCYCGRVRTYDLEAALAALAKLSDEEQCALITWVVRNDEAFRQPLKAGFLGWF
jgi:hypothetical protein